MIFSENRQGHEIYSNPDFKKKVFLMKTKHLPLSIILLSLHLFLHAAPTPPAPLAPPPQDQGLPYTRSSIPKALEKIRDGIAVFPGSRYGYIRGHRVRLDSLDLLRSEAVEKEEVVYVPSGFAAAASLPQIDPPPDGSIHRKIWSPALP
jgi:hypothetical protein